MCFYYPRLFRGEKHTGEPLQLHSLIYKEVIFEIVDGSHQQVYIFLYFKLLEWPLLTREALLTYFLPSLTLGLKVRVTLYRRITIAVCNII